MNNKKIDLMITLIPLITIIVLCLTFIIYPVESNIILEKIRFFFGDVFGSFYLIVGLGIFIISLYIAFSKYGNIVLGNKKEKPKYSFLTWGSMMFTCGLAADILFYSFCEWILYAKDSYIEKLGGMEEWAGVLPLFHWGFIPWSFYLVLAVAFGFMLHVRKREKQKYSESCRPILGKYTDKWPGRVIDLLAVFALLAGTATTFSIATPLMSEIICSIFHITVNRNIVTIIILIITCLVYTYSLLHGIKGVSNLAKLCVYLFFGLLIFVLLFGGETKYIVENGVSSFFRMIQNFIGLATYTDPTRHIDFPQKWTIYYWAYWMVWCVAVPFFIGSISKGRTVRQTIIGGYAFGALSTIISFIILGNYSMGLQIKGNFDFISLYQSTGDIYKVIIFIVDTLPCSTIFLIFLLLTMMLFYATSFDSIAYTASCYSYKKLKPNESPHYIIKLIWCILLILLPIGLVFSKSSLTNLQSVSIVAAFPIAIVIVLIVFSFLKDAKKDCLNKDKIK